MIKPGHIILLLIMVVSACRNDSIVPSVTTTELPPVEDIYVNDLQGLVVDVDLNPIAQATVTVGNISTMTNDQGIWTMDDVTINSESGTYVGVEADDHYAGGNRIYTNNSVTSQVVTQLVAYPSPNIFNTSDPEVVDIDRASIDFTGASFVSDDGTDYTGSVSVYSYHLNPDDVDFLDRSPGDLSASNSSGERVGLQSFGMLAVELVGASGEELHLSSNSTASITIEVSPDLLSAAPPTIPLWSYDEVLGLWIEEGSATLQGNTYVGVVKHFSWWNCDVEIDPISLCLELNQPETGSALQGIVMVLCDDRLGSAMGTTDATGTLCGIVPRDRVITLKILNACNEVVHMETIGPFSMDTDIVVDYIPDPMQVALLEGAITSCDPNVDLSDMIVTIETEYDQMLAMTDVQGNYTATINLCEAQTDYNVKAISISNSLSGYGTGTATAGGSNLLDIDICDDLPLLVLYDQSNNVLLSTTDVELLAKPNETLIVIEDGVIGWSGRDVGNFPANVLIEAGIQASKSGGTTITISSWGPVGSMVSGTIDGINNVIPSQLSTFTGEFTARRTE